MKIKRKVEEWSIKKLNESRDNLIPADYQRDPRLWTLKDKKLLIDSILQGIDIPKLYLYKTESGDFEVVDGQQRIYAIYEFIDDGFSIKTSDTEKKFSELESEKDLILKYDLQITIISDVSDEYIGELFQRLQLGLPLTAGEKLKALTGEMRDFIFNEMAGHPFIETVNIKNLRYAKETLCAQICINYFCRTEDNKFIRTRFNDLHDFVRNHSKIKAKEAESFKKGYAEIKKNLDILDKHFGQKAQSLRNKSFILSIYLFIEDVFKDLGKTDLNKTMPVFVAFVEKFQQRLKEESKKDPFEHHDEINRDLYTFRSYLSNAPGEPYQIENRHKALNGFFEYYKKHRKIKNDK